MSHTAQTRRVLHRDRTSGCASWSQVHSRAGPQGTATRQAERCLGIVFAEEVCPPRLGACHTPSEIAARSCSHCSMLKLASLRARAGITACSSQHRPCPVLASPHAHAGFVARSSRDRSIPRAGIDACSSSNRSMLCWHRRTLLLALLHAQAGIAACTCWHRSMLTPAAVPACAGIAARLCWNH